MWRLACTLLLCAFPALAAALEPTISLGYSHALVSKSDGAVVGWGSDVQGLLGNGRPILRTAPSRVLNVPAFTQLSTAAFHSVALDTNGRVWTWGQNDHGQLGPRVQRNGALPGRVSGVSGVIQVAASARSTFALKGDGTLWYWGESYSTGGANAQPEKMDIEGVAQISAGFFHVLARLADGSVVGFGLNDKGQLGGGFHGLVWDVPVDVLLPGPAADISALGWGGVARLTDGTIHHWGVVGVQGGGILDGGVAFPTQRTGIPLPVTRFFNTVWTPHARLADGSLWKWEMTVPPSQVAGFSNVQDGVVNLNETTTAVIRADGRLFVKSVNALGERGLGTLGGTAGDITQVPSPINFKSVDINDNCIQALTTTGEVWVWGADANGSLADGAIQTTSVPRPVPGVANIKKVSAWLDSSFALDTNGNVWAWGANGNSQFGGGLATPSSTPVQVPITNVKDISAGGGGVLFLKNDDTCGSPATSSRSAGRPRRSWAFRRSGRSPQGSSTRTPSARRARSGPGGSTAGARSATAPRFRRTRRSRSRCLETWSRSPPPSRPRSP